MGCYDAKATTDKMMKTLTVSAQSGPTHDDLPAFHWDEPMPVYPNNMSHAGQPNLWAFDFVTIQPAL